MVYNPFKCGEFPRFGTSNLPVYLMLQRNISIAKNDWSVDLFGIGLACDIQLAA
jgi:hypothetical protein